MDRILVHWAVKENKALPYIYKERSSKINTNLLRVLTVGWLGPICRPTSVWAVRCRLPTDHLGAGVHRCSRIYPGPRPFSEPELRAIVAFLRKHPNVLAAVSYHSCGQFWMTPYGYRRGQRPRHFDTLVSGAGVGGVAGGGGVGGGEGEGWMEWGQGLLGRGDVEVYGPAKRGPPPDNFKI